MIVYRKIEDIITKMQDDKTGGVPIRTVKSFLSKIPSVVTGEFLSPALPRPTSTLCELSPGTQRICMPCV